MKKISIFIAVVAAAFLTSCLDDYLEVKSQSTFSDDVIFSQPALTEGFIYGIYNITVMNNSYRNRMGQYHGLNSDTEYRRGMKNNKDIDASANARDVIAWYSATSGMAEGYNNAGDDNPWSYMYQAIEKCNLAITNIRKYGNTGNREMAHLLGEALTLRAFYYFDLIKWWGDVPARFEPVNSETIAIAKTPRADIYRQIISDLGEAAALVAWNGELPQTATTQRVSKAFVKGLRARVCLAAAGKAMLPVGEVGSKIDYIFEDESVRRGYYNIARQECLDVINSTKYRLETDFTQIFRSQCQYDVSAGRESIFELPYKPDSRGQMYYFYGLAWKNDGLYVQNASSGATGIGGSVFVVPSFFYDYNANDLRRDATAVPYTMEFTAGVTTPTMTHVTEFQLAKWRADYCKTILSNNDDGMGLMIMRYADILLMYAEADLYIGATDGADYLNQVRRRGFGVSNATYDVTLTLDNIKKERAFEFCGENIRKFDLIRWGELGTNIKALKNKMIAIRDQTGDYSTVPQTLYYRTKFVTGSTKIKTIEIYGLNRGETTAKPAEDGWVEYPWTNEVRNSMDEINATWLDNFIYRIDPDLHQLIPINQAIINSNAKLSNSYGY